MPDPIAPSSSWLTLTLSWVTPPLLAGLWIAQTAQGWLETLSTEDALWWSGDRLPPLSRQDLAQRSAPLDSTQVNERQ